jgi:hypothetical protein
MVPKPVPPDQIKPLDPELVGIREGRGGADKPKPPIPAGPAPTAAG